MLFYSAFADDAEGSEALFGAHVAPVVDAALRGAQPSVLLRRAEWIRHLQRPLDAYRRVVVLGIGKASMAMGAVVEAELGARVDAGLLVVPHGYPETLPARYRLPQRCMLLQAGHPIPDAASTRAAERLLDLAEQAGPEDLVLVLLSGGGTALTAAFQEGITLADGQAAFDLLIRAGADIEAMNTVRKHLTRIGGGQLARAAVPAEVLTLTISDVVGDDLSVIASGPTVPDPTTYRDALGVLERFELLERIPRSVGEHLDRGRSGRVDETPSGAEPWWKAVRTELIGTNRDALKAAAEAAAEQGLQPVIVSSDVIGEARDVARRQVAEALARSLGAPCCLLWGGEPTVTVRGTGRGGRNQEWTLAAALALAEHAGSGRSILAWSVGTDGRDGPTDAAGAWADAHTVRRAVASGLDARAALEDNDAYSFFDAVGQLLRPGATHTNVMDVQGIVLLG